MRKEGGGGEGDGEVENRSRKETQHADKKEKKTKNGPFILVSFRLLCVASLPVILGSVLIGIERAQVRAH